MASSAAASTLVRSLALNTDGYVPMLGLGTFQVKPGGLHVAVKAAIVAGYRLIDCAGAATPHRTRAASANSAANVALAAGLPPPPLSSPLVSSPPLPSPPPPLQSRPPQQS